MQLRAGKMPALRYSLRPNIMDDTAPHRGWYSRGYLPHIDLPGLVQLITFRLYDSLPASVLDERETVVAGAQASCLHPAPQGAQVHRCDAARLRKIERYLDAGHGSCFLRKPEVATIVEQALLHFDGQRYRLHAWVVMPNHVHVLVEQFHGRLLSETVHSWKSYTANQANALLERRGRFWQRESFDRFIRNDRHFEAAMEYVHANPVRAGLVGSAEDWPFGSARFYSG